MLHDVHAGAAVALAGCHGPPCPARRPLSPDAAPRCPAQDASFLPALAEYARAEHGRHSWPNAPARRKVATHHATRRAPRGVHARLPTTLGADADPAPARANRRAWRPEYWPLPAPQPPPAGSQAKASQRRASSNCSTWAKRSWVPTSTQQPSNRSPVTCPVAIAARNSGASEKTPG